MIGYDTGTFEIDAEEIGKGLGLRPEDVMQGLKDGLITSISELGVDADAGRHRLTFYAQKRRLRLIVDANGAILKRSSADYSREMFGLAFDPVASVGPQAPAIPPKSWRKK